MYRAIGKFDCGRSTSQGGAIADDNSPYLRCPLPALPGQEPKVERYAAISVAILGDPISNCGPLVVTAEHNRSLEEVGGRPSRPEWLVYRFNQTYSHKNVCDTLGPW